MELKRQGNSIKVKLPDATKVRNHTLNRHTQYIRDVRKQLDLVDTALTGLTASLQNTPLFWNRVPIDQRLAFHPETITDQEIQDEPDPERREVLLERAGQVALASVATGRYDW